MFIQIPCLCLTIILFIEFISWSILNVKLLSDLWFASICSFCRCLFASLLRYFDAQKFLLLVQSSLSICSLCIYCQIYLRILCQVLSRDLSLCFSQSFIVLVFLFRLFYPFWVHFCTWDKIWVPLHSFIHTNPIIPTYQSYLIDHGVVKSPIILIRLG